MPRINLILTQKQKILNQKIEISEKLKNFERKGNLWLEPRLGEPRRARRASVSLCRGASRRGFGRQKI
jgi:hypothetical protein